MNLINKAIAAAENDELAADWRKEPAQYAPVIRELVARVAELEGLLSAAQQGVPEGWKLVPVEPQDAQQAAGATAIRFDTTLINKMWTANKVYREMVAAAPQSPASGSASADARA